MSLVRFLLRFVNLNFGQGFLDLNQSLAMLLYQLHFLEFEHLIIVCLLINFLLLMTICLFKRGHSLSQFKLVDLLLEFAFFSFPKFFFLLIFEARQLLSDLFFE